MTPHLLDQVARRLPLVPRTKVACPPLGKRLNQIRARAGSPETAAAALNLAALTASDCGMPDLARELCLRQAHVFLSSPQGYDVPTAKLALQPLINLARLHTRDGAGGRAHAMFEALYRAAQARTVATVAGVEIDFAQLTEDHQAGDQIHRWLGTVMLSDGTRALTSTGDWAKALAHVQQHSEIGARMLEGRQIAILAHSTDEDHDQALAVAEATRVEEPWEEAVTSILTVLCLLKAERETGHASFAMVDSVSRTQPSDGAGLFHTRLGLCAADLAVDADQRAAAVKTVLGEAEGTQDAHVARELLTHDLCGRSLTAGHKERLEALVRFSCLGAGALPQAEGAALEKAVRESVFNLRRLVV